MDRQPLALDTSLDIERRQIEGWRRMAPADKARTVRALTRTAIAMTVAGIQHRHPDEPPASHRRRLAEILLGPELARHVVIDIDTP